MRPLKNTVNVEKAARQHLHDDQQRIQRKLDKLKKQLKRAMHQKNKAKHTRIKATRAASNNQTNLAKRQSNESNLLYSAAKKELDNVNKDIDHSKLTAGLMDTFNIKLTSLREDLHSLL